MNPSALFLSPKYSDALLALSDSELGLLTRALLLYSKDGTLPSFSVLDKAVQVAFEFIRADIDESRARYAARCQRNRENAAKRWRRCKTAKGKEKTITANADAPASTPSHDCKKDAPSTGDTTVNYDALLQFWNKRIDNTHSRIPKVSAITTQRRSLLAARLRECGGDTRILRNAFERAFRSPWLNGQNPSHWIADFNWILAPANFSRVLEGTFDDHNRPVAPSTPLPERPQPSPEQAKAMKERQKKERQQRDEQQLRDNMLAAIRSAERYPRGHAATVVAEAYASGTLRRLGIAWTPQQQTS